MSSSEVPFYAQAGVLDRYIHSSDPGSDPEALEVILEMLKSQSQKDLRDYFFRSGPSAAWASILWDHGFFESPPPPEKTEAGSLMLPRWDVQEYLITVASEVPDIVIRHIESLQGPGWYLSRGVRALCFVPAEQARGAISKVKEWLKDPAVAGTIASETYDLITKLSEEGESSVALGLFRELTAPVPPSDAEARVVIITGGATCKFRGDWNEDQVLKGSVELLQGLDVREVMAILEDHLCTALCMEASAMGQPDFEFTSWWRTAVEETGQDLDLAYRDRLLTTLRDTLETWVRRDASAVEPLVQRYLGEEHQVLRRVGLHILHRFPTTYSAHVANELRRVESLEDVGIHHEYFMLLQRGYPVLDGEDQETLVAAICRGPSPEPTQALAKWAQRERGADPEEYAEYYSKRWIRDRLWMVRNHLSGRPAQLLREMVDELEEPKHPAFTRWTTGGFQVTDVSPITEQEISDMTPDELVAFLKGWRTDPAQQFGPEMLSYRGLANVVASVVIADPLRYGDDLATIALHRPEFASSLLRAFREDERDKDIPWGLMINLCERLLADDVVRQDMSFSVDGNWIDVRRSIIRLIELGLRNPERAIPAEHLPDVRGILLALLNDPDPAEEPSPENWTELKDPATSALNYVRPSALRVLVDYAALRARLETESAQVSEPEGPGPKRLEPDIGDVLARKLDRSEDPSWAVHSVYGHHLALLYWLDQEWVESHIDQILPEGEDDQSTWLFVAAWDSFIGSNRFYPPMLEVLRPKYRRAIHNLHRGYVTHSHLMPDRGLAIHLVWEYLRSDYDLNSPTGQQSLIATFFKLAPPEARGGPAWWLWRIGEENPSEFEKHWSKVRFLWEWRVHEASAANHSTDFDEEMRWFAHLLLVVPARETMTSLWPLLEGLLSHITRSKYRNIGWDSVEKYLSVEVERDPVRAIQFYHLMHDQLTEPRRYYPEEARKILKTAAACSHSRQEALSLIDSIFRSGDRQFLDILERYAG